DVLHDVAEAPAAFDHAVVEDGETLLEQDDIGGVLGDVDRVLHGDPHVGGAEGGRVVDPVTHTSHHVAARAERQHDAILLDGREAGGDRGALPQRAQGGS